MRTEEIMGAWYGDLDLLGNYVALIANQHILFNRTNVIPLPPPSSMLNNLLYIKTHKGYIAGKGQWRGTLQVWNGQWNELGLVHGDHSPILLHDAKIYVVRTGRLYEILDLYTFKSLGFVERVIDTQGLRFILNSVITTGDESINDGFVAEYTGVDNINIGSGNSGGLVAHFLSSGVRKQIEPGHCTFVRAYKGFNNFAVCTTKPDRVVYKWFTLAELLLMPNDNVIIPPPIIIPPIDPIEPPMTPNHNDIVNEAFDNTLADINPPRTTKVALGFIQETLSNLPVNEHWGYVKGPSGGENVEPLEDGTYVRISRIMIPDGSKIKILSNAPDGGPQWVEELDDDPNLYHPYDGIVVPPDGNTEIEEDVEELKQKVSELEEELNELKRVCIKFGDHLALQTNTGFFVCAENEGVDQDEVAGSVRLPGNVNATRTSIGGWEQFKTVKP